MKKKTNSMFNPGTYDKKLNLTLLLFRLAAGGLMLTHGMGKFTTLFGSEPIQFPDPLGVGAITSLALTVFAEVLCALLIMIGLATRFAAVSLLITMLVAAFVIHADDPISKQELSLLYATIYFVIAVTGAGKFSIDRWIFSRK